MDVPVAVTTYPVAVVPVIYWRNQMCTRCDVIRAALVPYYRKAF